VQDETHSPHVNAHTESVRRSDHLVDRIQRIYDVDVIQRMYDEDVIQRIYDVDVDPSADGIQEQRARSR
jgi:hypothetical protein